MKRRLLGLAALVVASFSLAAGAVAYFVDSEETYDVVRAGPPIPWLKLWSQGTDPVNLDAVGSNNLSYATRNDQSPTLAATGKVDGATETLGVHLGDRSSGNTTWKANTPGNAFNRLFTVEVPSDVPVTAGQTVTLTMSQENAVPALSSGNLMFSALQFASITAGANSENQAGFAGTGAATTVQLAPGAKRQVNVSMAAFGQTDSQSNRIVNTAIVVHLTTPDGDTRTYRVPVTVCNHVAQC